MNITEYKICSRCVMDSSDPIIKFNSNGYCNHCTDFMNTRLNYNYKGEKRDKIVARLIKKIKEKGKGKKYDCLIGISGGIDSCYAAYILKNKGLRILAVHLDNGWNTETSVSNIENIVKKLEIDFESYVLDWEEFREIQLSFLKASVPEAETPTDIAILAALHKVAAKYKINYIISGGNFSSEGILPKLWHYNAKDKKYFKYIHKTFGIGKIKTFPLFGFEKEFYYKMIKGIKIIYVLNFIPFSKNEAIKVLENVLEWKNYSGKHHESVYTKFIQSYYLYEKFGIDYRRATLSSQICSNEISREQALTILKTKPYNEETIKSDKEYISKKLNISLDELEKIINYPAKWFYDYPNENKKLNLIYNIYLKIFKKEKLSNY